MNKQFKKYIAVFVTTIFLFTQNFAVGTVLALPDVPELPDNSSEETQEPEETPEPTVKPTPETPKLPDNNPTPTPKPSATPEVKAVATQSPTPTPTPTNNEYETAENLEAPDAPKAPEVDTNSGDENTGNVNSDGQLGGAKIDTGTAAGSGSIMNTGNTNVSSDQGAIVGNGGGDISIVSEGNGTNSENTGTVALEDNNITFQDNNANIDNELEVDVNSGNNTASKNVGGTNEIDTGSATAVGTIVNSVNTNVAGAMVSEFNVDDNQIGDLILDYEANCVSGCGSDINLANKNNGSDSTNSTDLGIVNNETTFQNNDAQVENDLILSANTGNNQTNNNTNGNNIIDTGDANVSGSVINMLNNNIAGNVIYGVVNILDDFVGNIIVPEKYASAYATDIAMANNGNGSNSTNNGEVFIVDNESFTQYNQADIVNNLEIDANTGGNDVSKNTSGNNEVDTGNVNVDASILNIANNNVVGGDWWIVLVNEAGNWIGKIFTPQGALNGGNFAAAGGSAVENSGDGAITLSNNGNGSGSTNTGSIDQTSNSETVQSNKAAITNNIKLAANTGNNSASRNTGGSSQIDTGDANIQFNLVNFLNNNFAGGNVFLTVVNVFGSWTGDFVTPNSGHESENKDDDKAIGGNSEIADNHSSNNNSDNNNSHNSNSTNNSESSNSSSNTDNTSGQAVLAAQSKVDNDPYGWGTGGAIASGETDEKNPFDIVDEAKASDGGETDSKRKINLAWALLLIPTYFVVRILRARFSS